MEASPLSAGISPAPLMRKVCGMRSAENIRDLLALQPDWLGFIFYPGSSRFVGEALDPEFLKQLPAETKKVGVFVNATREEILAARDLYHLEAAQLHGEESPMLCRELREAGLIVFKAFPVADDFDFNLTVPYERTSDYFLFDTKGQQYGGNGTTFNWDILRQYSGSTPYLLSGGIGPEHARQIRDLKMPKMAGIDINSRFEISPGFKDPEKVKAFFDQISAG